MSATTPILISGGFPANGRVDVVRLGLEKDDRLPIIRNSPSGKQGEPVTAQRPQRAQPVEDCPQDS